MGKGRGKGRSNIEGLDPESPRTLEACLHRGLTVEELRPRDEKTFRRGMESAEFTHRRYEFFEKRRQDKIALVKSRRNDLVKKSERYEGPGGLSTGEKRALEEAAKQKAATIEIERKRVESIKRKQQQEIARIIEKEKVLTNMQEHLKHIQELEAERAAKHQEKRDKAKQKAPVRVDITPSRPARRRRVVAVGRGLRSFNEPVRAAAGPRGRRRAAPRCERDVASMACRPRPRRRRDASTSSRVPSEGVRVSREPRDRGTPRDGSNSRKKHRLMTNAGRGQKTGDAGAARASGGGRI